MDERTSISSARSVGSRIPKPSEILGHLNALLQTPANNGWMPRHRSLSMETAAGWASPCWSKNSRMTTRKTAEDRPRDANETLRDTSPFGHLWSEALTGEVIIERFLRGDSSFERSPIALMPARYWSRRWRCPFANASQPSQGWALGTLFPEFDRSSLEPIKRRINHAAVASSCPSLFGRHFWRACRGRLPIPPSCTLSETRRSFRGRTAFERLCEEARIDDNATWKSHPT